MQGNTNSSDYNGTYDYFTANFFNGGTLSGDNSGDDTNSYLLDTTDTFTGVLTVDGEIQADSLNIDGTIISNPTAANSGVSMTMDDNGVTFDANTQDSQTIEPSFMRWMNSASGETFLMGD